jgi:hypothetical protein
MIAAPLDQLIPGRDVQQRLVQVRDPDPVRFAVLGGYLMPVPVPVGVPEVVIDQAEHVETVGPLCNNRPERLVSGGLAL